MLATEILMDEHRVIERVIASLEQGAQRLGQAVPFHHVRRLMIMFAGC